MSVLTLAVGCWQLSLVKSETIAFPESKWEDWYDYWIINHDNKRFYRYLKEGDTYVGEIAYHLDEKRNVWIADVIIPFEYRGKGYGTQGLGLLCEAAANNGIAILYDDIAIDNPGISIFLKAGFCEEYRTDEYIMLKKVLSNRNGGKYGAGRMDFKFRRQ